MDTFSFEPSARLQRLLSRELISDPNLAVIELVKNGYDAGATEVTVDLTTGGLDPLHHRLVVADNGSGMSEQEFRQNWMHPGYSEKAKNPGAPITVKGHSRVPVGEKGLGRLAAGRLGEKLTVYTRKRVKDQWFKLEVDWRRFDDMDQLLRDVHLPGQLVDTVPSEAYPRGTLLTIEHMTVDLTGKIPGRKVAGRPDNRFGRLSQDLRLLTTSAGRGSASQFSILLNVDEQSLQQYAGAFQAIDSLIEGQFAFNFDISMKDGDLRIERRCWQGDEDENQRLIVDLAGTIKEVGEVQRAPHPRTLEAGPIQGSFSYAPPVKRQREALGVPPGVFLYRDGVRVEPYGEPESDWVGAYSRKASRQGYAPIQPKYLFGSIHIGRRLNPGLTDMSNRQGLIENEGFNNLINHVRAEFAFFEQVVQDHRQTPRWEQSQARKRQAAAQQRVQASRVQSRALAHAVRQPLTGMGAELFILRQVISDPRLPSDLRSKLEDLRSRLERAANDIGDRVQAFLQASDEEIRDFELTEIFEAASDRTSLLAVTRGGAVKFEPDETSVSFAFNVLLEALVELATNGLSAPDVPGRSRLVLVTTDQEPGMAEVLVTDNGPGLPASRADRPFDVGMSVSGRPGHGLVAQKLNLLGAGGDLDLNWTGPEGTQFAVKIPLSVETLRL